MRALVAIEFTKIVRRRMNQIVLAVFSALLVVVYVLLWLASDVVAQVGTAPEAANRLRSALYLEETVPFAMLMLYAFGFVAGVVVIGSNVGSEYGWNTVRTVTAAEPRRALVLFAKVATLWVVVVLGMVFGLIIMLATSALITLTAGEFDLSFVDAEYVTNSVYSFLRLLAGTSPYFALAILMAVIGKSATSGIALSLGVAFLEGIVSGLMSLAGGTLAKITSYMLDTNADTLGMSGGGQIDEMFGSGSAIGQIMERPGLWHAAIVLLCWASAFLSISFWVFHRQDVEYQG